MTDRPIKQIIVIRKDLKMRRGKEIAQGAHASMAFLRKAALKSTERYRYVDLSTPELLWLENGQTKVTVVVNSEKELLDVYQKALDANLEAHLITDAGATEFHGVPTKTALAIGPDYTDLIDRVTGDLKLY